VIEEGSTRCITRWGYGLFFFNDWRNAHPFATLAYLTRNAIEQNFETGKALIEEVFKFALHATGVGCTGFKTLA
jgi:hypothetical protein